MKIKTTLTSLYSIYSDNDSTSTTQNVVETKPEFAEHTELCE
jgi:hypothetical protein